MTTTKPKVQWSEPPHPKSGTQKYAYFWEALRANPGKWAIYPGHPGGVASTVSRMPGFESTNRGPAGDQVAYVRYVGE